MGRNLPPGVSVGDLPDQQDPPRCTECDKFVEGSNAAIEQGIPLCDEHATEDNIEAALEQKRLELGIECGVCHKPLLPSEADYEGDTPFCDSHDFEDYREQREYEDERRREAMERDRRQQTFTEMDTDTTE